MTFWASLRKELMEQVRTRRLLVTLTVLVVFAMLSPVMAKLMPELFKSIPGADQFASLMPAPTVNDAIVQYVKNINQFSFVLALLLPMGAVVVEKEKGTAAMMLVKPLPRGTFLLTKFLAFGITFLSAFAVAGLAGYFYTWYLFEALDFGAWVIINLLLWLYAMLFVSITLFFSTLMKSQALAAGISFGILIILSILGGFPNVAEYLPAQLVAWSSELLLGVNSAYWPAFWTSIAVIFLCYFFAWWIFSKQEL